MSRSVFASPNRKCTPLASHQAISSSRAKPEVSAQQNAHQRPTAANVGDDARHLLHRAGRSVDFARRSLAANRWRPQNT